MRPHMAWCGAALFSLGKEWAESGAPSRCYDGWRKSNFQLRGVSGLFRRGVFASRVHRMRTHITIATTLAGLTLALPTAAHAQKFQEPTREELQMTSDPKAPGAPAVILDRENTVDNETFATTEHVRIKVLTQPGKDWATVEFPYDPRYHDQPEIEGRTIHADGTIVPLSGDAKKLISFRDRKAPADYYFPKKVAVFPMPDPDVGSILEYRWTLRIVSGKKPTTEKQREISGLSAGSVTFSIPRWDVQRDLYIHREHFFYLPYPQRLQLNGSPNFTPFKYGQPAKFFLHSERLPAGAHVLESPNHDYTLDVADIPPMPNDPDSPAARGRAYAVQFYFSPYPTAADTWSSEIRFWASQLKESSNPTGFIRQASSQIVAGATSPEETARKLYDAVQALANTDVDKTSGEVNHGDLDAKTPDESWRDRSGSSHDLAQLYIALARAAGLDATGLLTVDRS